MSFPAAVAICENDLRLDQTFLKAFAGTTVDLRVTPLHGGTLSVGTIRLVRGQIDAMRKAGVPVGAVVVHHDVDRSSLAHRRDVVESWFSDGRFREQGLALVICAPEPSLERWLRICEGIQSRVKAAKPSAGGDPWKDLWKKGKGITLDRVRAAAQHARAALRGQPDFDRFYGDWKAAGLERA